MKNFNIIYALILIFVSINHVELNGQVTRTWLGVTDDWHEPSNWSPVGVPGGQDDVIHRNIGNTISLNGMPTTGVDTIRISEGGQLFTAGGILTVNDFGNSGWARVIGNGSELVVEPNTTASTAVSADAIEIESGGAMIMQGGNVRVDNLISVDVSSRISGFGNIEILAADSGNVPTVMTIDGTIRSIGDTLSIFTEQNAVVNFGSSNLDAAFGDLFLSVTLEDSFAGTITIGPDQVVLSERPFDFSPTATLNLFGGEPDGPALFYSPDTDVYNRINVSGSAALSGSTDFRGPATINLPNAEDELRITGSQSVVQGNVFNPMNATPSFNGLGRITNETLAGMALLNRPEFAAKFVNKSKLNLVYFYLVLLEVGRAEFGDFVQTQDGVMRFDIGQNQDSQLIPDVYTVNGVAELAGKLEVQLVNLNNFGLPELQVGDSFEVIAAAGGIVGTFDEVTFSHTPAGTYWQIEYTVNSVRITLSDILIGDINGDGMVDLLDVAPFVDAVVTGNFLPSADINQDGIVDLLDVQPFIAILVGS